MHWANLISGGFANRYCKIPTCFAKSVLRIHIYTGRATSVQKCKGIIFRFDLQTASLVTHILMDARHSMYCLYWLLPTLFKMMYQYHLKFGYQEKGQLSKCLKHSSPKLRTEAIYYSIECVEILGSQIITIIIALPIELIQTNITAAWLTLP